MDIKIIHQELHVWGSHVVLTRLSTEQVGDLGRIEAFQTSMCKCISEDLLKCQFWFSRFGVEPACLKKNLPGDSNVLVQRLHFEWQEPRDKWAKQGHKDKETAKKECNFKSTMNPGNENQGVADQE